jgi:hypothetical protein
MGKRTKEPNNESAVREYRELVQKKEELKKSFETFQIDLRDLTLDYKHPDQRQVIQEGIEKLVKSYESTGVQADKQPISVLKKKYSDEEEMPKTLGEKYIRGPPTSLAQSRSRFLVVNGQHRIKALMRFDEDGWQNRTWNANVYDEEVVNAIHPEYMAWLCENLEVTQGIATSVKDKVVALRAKGYEFCIGPGLLNYMLANATEEDYKTQSALQSRMRVLATFPEKGLMPRADPTCLRETCSEGELATLYSLFTMYLSNIGPALMLDYSKTFAVLVQTSYQVAHFSLNQLINIIKKQKNVSHLSAHKLFEFLPRFLAVGFVASTSTLLSKEMTEEQEGQFRDKLKRDLAYYTGSNSKPLPESILVLFKSLEIMYYKELKELVEDMAEKKLAKAGNFEKQGLAQARVAEWFRSIAPVPVSTGRYTEASHLKVEHDGEVISAVNVHIGDFFQWAFEAENKDKYPFVFGDVPYFVTDKACDSISESMKLFPVRERTPRNFVEKVLTALKNITKKDAQVILYCSREQQILFGELCKEDEDFRAFDLFVNYGRSTSKSQLNRTYNCSNVLDYAVQLIRGSPSWTTWGCAFDSRAGTSVDIKMMPNLFESKERPTSTDLRPFPKDEALNSRFIEYFARTDTDGRKHPVLDVFAGSGSMIIPAALAGFNLDLVELDAKNVETYKKKVTEANNAVAEQANLNNANLMHNRVKHRKFKQAEKTASVLKRKRASDRDESGDVHRSDRISSSDEESAEPDVSRDVRDVSAEEEREEESGVSREVRDMSAEEEREEESEEESGVSREVRDMSAEEERGSPEESREEDQYAQEKAAKQAGKQAAIKRYKKAEKNFLPNPTSSKNTKKTKKK